MTEAERGFESRRAADERANGAASDARDDALLVERVLGGERDAFSSLVRRHQDELHRYARNIGIDGDAAADLVQDAFVTAYLRLAQCSEPARFRFWLLRILRNRCLDWLRDVRRNAVPIDDVVLADATAGPHETTEDAELGRRLGAALSSLPDDLRDAFLMKHHEGRSYQEMARIADASVSAMKMRVHRAREALRSALAPADAIDGF